MLFLSLALYTHCHHLSFPRVTDTKTTVFASGAKETSIVIPADVVDEVRVVIHCDQSFSSTHIPDYDQIITTCVVKHT